MNSSDFYRKRKEGKLDWERCDEYTVTVDPNDIILDEQWNGDYPGFWNHHGGSKEAYFEYVRSGKADNSPPPNVSKWGDKYVLDTDGSHRVASSKELNRPINVKVTGVYKERRSELVEYNDMEMSM